LITENGKSNLNLVDGIQLLTAKSIEAARNLEALGIVERDGPESVDRRGLPFVEMNCVAVRSVERPTCVVGEIADAPRLRWSQFRSFASRPQTGILILPAVAPRVAACGCLG
jgi:hypothetical protein